MTYYLYMVARRQQPGGLQLGQGTGSREVTWDHYSTLSQETDGGCAIKCAHWYCQDLHGVDMVGSIPWKLFPCCVLCFSLYSVSIQSNLRRYVFRIL